MIDVEEGGMGFELTGAQQQAILDMSGVGLWRWDPNEDNAQWSEQAHRLLGRPSAPAEGALAQLLSSIVDADMERVAAAFHEAVRSPATELRVTAIALIDGEERARDWWGTVLADGEGQRVLSGSVVDATERQRAEVEAREHQEHLRLFLRAGLGLRLRIDLGKPVLAPEIVAGSFERTTSFMPEEVAERGGWLAVIHPDDR